MNRSSACITIIIPVYNVDLYLPRCLKSLQAQTFSAYECILVNDGSTDRSGLICDEYAKQDDRFTVIHCSNGGPSSARNIGLEHVKTKWVTFIDADDYVTPDFIKNFFKYNDGDIFTQVIQGYHCIGYDQTPFDTLYPDTRYLYNVVSEGCRSTYIEDNNVLYNWAVWCKIFSIDVIRKNRIYFEKTLMCGEDGLFWHTYLCYVKKIIFIPEQGYIYFCPRQFNSVSRGSKVRMSTEQWLILANDYKSISNQLIDKFRIGSHYAVFLQMLYVNNYFKVLMKAPTLTTEQFLLLKNIRPSKGYFIPTLKGVIYWILNLFPIKVSRFIYKVLHR